MLEYRSQVPIVSLEPFSPEEAFSTSVTAGVSLVSPDSHENFPISKIISLDAGFHEIRRTLLMLTLRVYSRCVLKQQKTTFCNGNVRDSNENAWYIANHCTLV